MAKEKNDKWIKGLLASLILMVLGGSYVYTTIFASTNSDSIKTMRVELDQKASKDDVKNVMEQSMQGDQRQEKQMRLILEELLNMNRRVRDDYRRDVLEKFDSTRVDS